VAASTHIQFGTVPDWVTATGTTLAFLVAFIVLALEIMERHRSQASGVAAWLEREDEGAKVRVANSSDVPIYNVRVTPQLLGSDYELISYALIRPKADFTALNIPVPGASDVSNDYLGVEIIFDDSAGRHWRRDRNGKLHRRFRSIQKR
jgi:hypothetical protein